MVCPNCKDCEPCTDCASCCDGQCGVQKNKLLTGFNFRIYGWNPTQPNYCVTPCDQLFGIDVFVPLFRHYTYTNGSFIDSVATGPGCVSRLTVDRRCGPFPSRLYYIDATANIICRDQTLDSNFSIGAQVLIGNFGRSYGTNRIEAPCIVDLSPLEILALFDWDLNPGTCKGGRVEVTPVVS